MCAPAGIWASKRPTAARFLSNSALLSGPTALTDAVRSIATTKLMRSAAEARVQSSPESGIGETRTFSHCLDT
jgi:hypothetical protein